MPKSKKTIYLARHAKSSWSSDAKSDFDRPLSKRGLRDAGRIGKELKSLNWLPEVVISSPALRAKQTCHILCKNMGFPAEHILWKKDVYAAYTVTLLHIFNGLLESQQSIMLVGHNPSMEDLLQHFCGEDICNNLLQANGKLFTTGNIAKISFNDSWKNLAMGNAKLTSLLRPKEL